MQQAQQPKAIVTTSKPAFTEGKPTEQSRAHVPYLRATLVLCIGTLTLLPVVYSPQPILPKLSQDFHISPGVAGLTLSAFNVALALSLLVAGPLSDRLGRRPIIIVASLLLVVPTFLAAWTPTYGLLLVARAAQGVLASGIAAVAIAYLGDEMPPDQRGSAIGWYALAQSWSALVGRVGGGIIADPLGWRAMFVALGLLSLVGALTLTLGLPPARRFSPSDNMRGAFRLMAATLRSRVLISGYLVGFLLGVVLLGFLTYISYYLSEPPFNLSTTALGLIFLAYIFGLLAPLAGRLSTRIGRRPVITACLVIMTAGVILTRVQSLPVIILGIVLLALGLIPAFGLGNAYVGDHAAGRRGGATGLYLCGWYIGGAAGAAGLGPIWTLYHWPGVTLVALGAIVLNLLVLWVLGGKQQQKSILST
jgi:YNFM family putative membrane transporter